MSNGLWPTHNQDVCPFLSTALGSFPSHKEKGGLSKKCEGIFSADGLKIPQWNQLVNIINMVANITAYLLHDTNPFQTFIRMLQACNNY